MDIIQFVEGLLDLLMHWLVSCTQAPPIPPTF